MENFSITFLIIRFRNQKDILSKLCNRTKQGRKRPQIRSKWGKDRERERERQKEKEKRKKYENFEVRERYIITNERVYMKSSTRKL